MRSPSGPNVRNVVEPVCEMWLNQVMTTTILDRTDARVAALVAEYEARQTDRTDAADRWLDSLTDDEFFAVNRRWFGGES